MKKYLFILLILLSAVFTAAPRASAQTSSDLGIMPVVIDEKAKPRDILKESITVRNMSNHVLQLYPTVNNINPEAGKQSFTVAANSDDLSASLANWIELSRGVIQLGPGEERSIPFIVRINLNAISGTYHAQITLTEGETRAIADTRAPLGVITVNLDVQADVKELLQLSNFSTGNVFLSGDDILFNYKLQNIGNQELQPKGQIHIYDRKGAEIATVNANKDSKTVSPDQETQLASVWSGANGFGRYKAMLDMEYGSSQTASVQDTVFFWVVPWKQMLIMFIISLAVMVALALYFHRWLERRHLYKFADAGFLNDHTLKKIHTEEAEDPFAAAAAYDRGREAVRRDEKSIKEVLHKESSHHPIHGSSIDLKQLRAHAQAAKEQTHQPHTHQESHSHKAEVHGHVISLKKHDK